MQDRPGSRLILKILLLTRKVVRQTYKKEMNSCRYQVFRDFCTQDTVWGNPFIQMGQAGRTFQNPLTKEG